MIDRRFLSFRLKDDVIGKYLTMDGEGAQGAEKFRAAAEKVLVIGGKLWYTPFCMNSLHLAIDRLQRRPPESRVSMLKEGFDVEEWDLLRAQWDALRFRRGETSLVCEACPAVPD